MRKISETFLEFLEPITDVLDPDLDTKEGQELMNSILKIGFVVWNAYPMDKTSDQSYDAWVMRVLPTEMRPFMKTLQERRRTEFGDDLRLIGHHGIIKKKGEWIFQAEARLAEVANN